MGRVDSNRSRSVKTSRPASKSAAKPKAVSSSAGKKSSPSKSSSPSTKPAGDRFESRSSKPEGRPSGGKVDNFVSARSTQHFASGTRNDIERFAGSSKADATTNKDGSVTRSRTTTSGQTTRSQELTTSKGPLAESRLRYTTTSETGGARVKNTYDSQTDVFGRTQSSHQRDASYEHGNRTLTRSRTESTDVWGTQKVADAQSKTVTHGEDSQTYSKSVTTDSRGNKAWSKDVTHVDKDGNTTVTRSSHKSGGTELTTHSSTSHENGKFTLSESADWKNTKFDKKTSYLKEVEVRPGTEDSGFSQTKKDKLGVAQTAGNVLGSAGARKEWKSEFNDVKENNLSTAPNTFVGSRVGTSGSQSFSVGADGVNASFNRDAKAGLYAQHSGQVTGRYGEASYNADARVEARASVDARGKLDTNGLDASVNARVGVSAEASINGRAQTQSVKIGGVDVNASVEGTARVSAEASAEATGQVKVTRNPPTAIAEGTVGASAVVKVEGEVKASAGPFSVNASAYASAGAEATATGVIGYEDGKLKIGGSAGAALGIGAGGSVNVEVDIKEIGDMARNTAVSVADVNNDGKLGLDDAKAAVSQAKDKALGWLGL